MFVIETKSVSEQVAEYRFGALLGYVGRNSKRME